MLHDVAAGMMYLHKRHYVHGDLRSPNLFVGSNGQVSCCSV
jgi:serine/threonine protein kinase